MNLVIRSHEKRVETHLAYVRIHALEPFPKLLVILSTLKARSPRQTRHPCPPARPRGTQAACTAVCSPLSTFNVLDYKRQSLVDRIEQRIMIETGDGSQAGGEDKPKLDRKIAIPN